MSTRTQADTDSCAQVLAIETEIMGRAAQPSGRPQGNSAVQYDPAARYEVINV